MIQPSASIAQGIHEGVGCRFGRIMRGSSAAAGKRERAHSHLALCRRTPERARSEASAALRLGPIRNAQTGTQPQMIGWIDHPPRAVGWPERDLAGEDFDAGGNEDVVDDAALAWARAGGRGERRLAAVNGRVGG